MSRLASQMPMLRAVLVGLAGALTAQAAGLPAAALIGASLAVSAAAWAGWRLAVPNGLRNIGFLGIGLSLGSGVGPAILHDLEQWALSLALLALSLVATLAVGAAILGRVAGQGRETALLSASPGTMSYALAIAEERHADVTAVLVVQSMRLFLLATLLPVLVQGLAGPATPLAAGPGGMALVPLAVLAVAGALAGAGLSRLGLPAAWLVAGFVISGFAHATGLATGLLPPHALFAAFCLTGTVIGTRFSGLTRADLGRNLAATLLAGAVSTAVSLGFALVAAGLTGLPLGQLWVAFAPGGVEAMAAIGLALGHDPAFIALHHLARIGILMLLLPLALRRGQPG